MDLPQRKIVRLPDYDYSTNGAYFVTICTYNRKPLFGDVGADLVSARMVCTEFKKTVDSFPQIACPKYVVMPNHFHAIIVIQRADTRSAPTIMDVVQAFKSRTTVEYTRLVKQGLLPPFEKHVWQRSFYEHVIRNDRDYEEIWRYIDENPLKWKLDRFYME